MLGAIVAFGALGGAESCLMSLLSKLVSPALARGVCNSGLLATEAGTAGRAAGDFALAFALKDKDAAMAAAFAFLRTKGAFPEDDGDDSDEMVFGDDDNLDDY